LVSRGASRQKGIEGDYGRNLQKKAGEKLKGNGRGKEEETERGNSA